jgi:hypothetical protein
MIWINAELRIRKVSKGAKLIFRELTVLRNFTRHLNMFYSKQSHIHPPHFNTHSNVNTYRDQKGYHQ